MVLEPHEQVLFELRAHVKRHKSPVPLQEDSQEEKPAWRWQCGARHTAGRGDWRPSDSLLTLGGYMTSYKPLDLRLGPLTVGQQERTWHLHPLPCCPQVPGGNHSKAHTVADSTDILNNQLTTC